MAAGAFVCLLTVIGLLVGLVLGSALLRAAVSVSNRLVRPPKEEFDPFTDWDWDGDPEERPRRKTERAIPEPSGGKGLMIAFPVGALNAFITITLAVLAELIGADPFEGDEGAQGAVLVLLTLPFGFVGTAALLAAMLPTTFARAALVAFVCYAIALTVLVAAGGALAVLLRF